jgi:hypothetical protein
MVEVLKPEPKTVEITQLDVVFQGARELFTLYPGDTITEHVDTGTIHIHIQPQHVMEGLTRIAEDIVIQVRNVLWTSYTTRTITLPPDPVDESAAQ